MAETGDLGALIVRIGADLEDLNRGLSDAEKNVRGSSNKIINTTKQIGLAMVAMGGFVASAFTLIAKATIEYGDELFEASQKTGVATEKLSTLKFVVEQSEGSFADLTQGLKFLNRSIFEANEGNSKFVETFIRLGISTRTSTGEALRAEDAFEQIADRFKNMKDESEKTALALQLFGRSGTNLIGTLSLGSEGIRELEETAKKLGLQLTSENAKQIDQLSDSIKAFKAELGALAVNLGIKILPAMKDFVALIRDQFQLVVVPILENMTAAFTKMKDVAGESLSVSGDPILTDARLKLNSLLEQRQKLKEDITIGKTAFGGAGTPQVAVNENKQATIEVEIERTKELLAARQEITNTVINEQIAHEQAAVAEEAKLEVITQEQDLWNQIKSLVEANTQVLSSQSAQAKQIAQDIIALGKSMEGAFSSALSGLIQGTLSGKEAAQQLGQSLVKMVVDFVAQFVIAHTIGKALQAAALAFGIVTANTLALAWSSAAAFVSLATFGANAGPAAAGITSTVGLATALAIPKLAEGGIVDRPTIALIGEAGPEAVTPLDKISGVGATGVQIGNVEIIIQGSVDRDNIDELVEKIGLKFEQEIRSAA